MDFEKLILTMHRKQHNLQFQFQEFSDVIHKKQLTFFGNQLHHIFVVSFKDSKNILEFKVDQTDDQDKYKFFLSGFMIYFEYEMVL